MKTKTKTKLLKTGSYMKSNISVEEKEDFKIRLKNLFGHIEKCVDNGINVTCDQLMEIVPEYPKGNGYPPDFKDTGRESIIIRIGGGDRKQEIELINQRIPQCLCGVFH